MTPLNPVLASGGSTDVLFGVAVLVIAAKVGGLLARRLGQPAVLGELLAGIGLGNFLPLVLGHGSIDFARSDSTLRVLGEIGVLILMFDVGLEADLRALWRVGPSALLVACIGVAAPFALGFGAAALLLPGLPTIAHVFIGGSLTATSVGITARVLKDLGALQSREGQTILGAAVLDDVFGLVILAVVGGMAVSGGEAGAGWRAAPWIVLKATLFLGLAALAGHLWSKRFIHAVGRLREPSLLLVLGLALCFLGARAAESIGLAEVLGAFAAGIMLDPYGEHVGSSNDDRTLAELLHPLSAVFVPLFFVLVGIQVDLSLLASGPALLLGGALVVVAVVGKLVAGLGVVGTGIRRLVVAVGMVPRGEVGLIFAGLGASLRVDGQPLLPGEVFSALVIMVVVTTLITPMALARLLRTAPASRPGQGG
jgi:Kef-type K+ transport system membrane component KefB